MTARRALTATFAAAAIAQAIAGSAQLARTDGTYRDRTGKGHLWSVNPSNALIWDGAPYLPVGGSFVPRSLHPGAGDDEWRADDRAIETLRTHGAEDVLIRPTASAADIPAPAWQRLIDRLEAAGMRYGIAFGPGITEPLIGTVVRPSSYRTQKIEPGSSVTWRAPDATSAVYVLVNETDGVDVYRQGRVDALDGMVTVPTDDRLRDGAIGLLYPRKPLARGPNGSLPDLWAGYDAYRDRLLRLFTTVRFGPGLRFFLDPLAGPIALEGEAETMVPESAGFRLEWEAFLARKYATLDELMTAWAIGSQKVVDFRQAASLIPLWYASKGVPYFLDPATNRRMQLSGNSPRFWLDLRRFETETVGYYMSALADLLKREVANVPVVYTHSMRHSVFTNPRVAGGFDGVGIAAYGQGTALITAGADAAVSQSQEAARPMWLVVTETADTPPGANKRSPGYSSRQSMQIDFEWLRGIGAKGIFAHAYQTAPSEPKGFDLLAAPEQLDWLRDASRQTFRASSAASGQARLLPFPASAAGLVHPGPIGSTGVWWTPSLAAGTALEFGTSYTGYTITLPDGQVTVLWSLRGARETCLFAQNPAGVTVTTVNGLPITARTDVRKKTITFLMPDTPVIIHTNGQSVYPMQAVEDALAQFRALVRQALDARLPVQPVTYTLERAEAMIRRADLGGAYLATLQGLRGAIAIAQPYTWLEAEGAETHSFSEAVQNAGASGGAMLSLNATTPPSADGYMASIPFNVPADEVYTVWASTTPPGPRASPFQWNVDAGDWRRSADGEVIGEHFLAEQLVWRRLGTVSLKRGSHTVRLRVLDPAPGTERWMLTVDSVLVTRGAFRPNGIARPSLDVLPPLPAAPPIAGTEQLAPPTRGPRRK